MLPPRHCSVRWSQTLSRILLSACLLASPLAQAAAELPPALTLSEKIKANQNLRAPIDPRLAEPNNLKLKLSLDLHTRPSGWRDQPLHKALRLLALLFLAPLLWQACADFARIFRSLLRSRPPQTPYLMQADWPDVSIVLCGQPPGSALSLQITQLLATDYPRQRLHFFPVFDPGHGLTRSSIERHLVLNPKNLHPVHLSEERPSTWSALRAAQTKLRGEIVILLDGKVPENASWLKHCVSPFFDPSVGAVQSAPQSGADHSLRQNFYALARAAQCLRQDFGSHWHLLPGALVAGLRISALRSRSFLLEASPATDAVMCDALAHQAWRSAWVSSSVRKSLAPSLWQQESAKLAARQAYRQELNPNTAPSYSRLQGLANTSNSWLAALFCGLGLLCLGDTLWAAYSLGAVMACGFAWGGGAASAASTAAGIRLHGNCPSIRLLPALPLSRLGELGWGLRTGISQLHWSASRLAPYWLRLAGRGRA